MAVKVLLSADWSTKADVYDEGTAWEDVNHNLVVYANGVPIAEYAAGYWWRVQLTSTPEGVES